MRLNNVIPYSKRDSLRKITIPTTLTPELSQIMAVILGDGHLECGKRYSQTVMYRINIAGSLSEDFAYYKKIINPIFLKLFNIECNFILQRRDELAVSVYSKAIAFFIKSLGIKPGRKVDNNKIPPLILNSNDEVKKKFIRGIFDTESSISFKKDNKGFHSKPIISISMKSKIFIEQLKELLDHFNFNPTCFSEKSMRRNKIHTRYTIELAGKKKLSQFLELINFGNPRHLTKIEIYKKFGFYPPRLKYKERLDILEGKIDPHSFY